MVQTAQKSELDILREQIAELLARTEKAEAQSKAFHDELVAIKEEHKEPVVDPNKPKTKVLVSEAKVRVFFVNPNQVKKVLRGTYVQSLPQHNNIALNPGCIVEVDEALADFLLTYKSFKIYNV